MNHIFISYQRSSEAWTTELAGRLREKGIAVWQDLSGKETGIPYSVKWWEIIEQALYRADGALIIRTRPWLESAPCSKEYRLMERNHIPRHIISEDAMTDMDQVIEEILQWYEKDVCTEENRKRVYVFSQAWNYSRDSSISHLLPGKIGFSEALHQYARYASLGRFVRETDVVRDNPEAAQSFSAFVKKAKRKIVSEQLFKLALGMVGLVGILAVAVFIQLLPYLQQSAQDSDYDGKTSAAMDIVRDVGEYDPVAAMSLLKDEPTAQNFNVRRSFQIMQFRMVDLLDVNYPSAFYPAGSPEALSVTADCSSSSSSIVFDQSGAVSVPIDGEDTWLMLDCIPSASCYLPETNDLLLAADRILYLYDLDSRLLEGIPFACNYEKITGIAYRDPLVYGLTDKGNVVCWQSPLQKKSLDLHLEQGQLLSDGRAACLDGESLVMLHGAKQQIVPLPYAESTDFAVFPDETRAGVLCLDDEGNTHLVVIALPGGDVLRDMPSARALHSLSVSSRDIVWAVSFDALVRLDLSTGRMDEAASGTPFWSVAACGDQAVVSDTTGRVALFDANLQQASGWADLTIPGLAPKQMAVAQDLQFVFAACRGGNTISGCRRVTLPSCAVHRLALSAESGLRSTTSVAVSEDGRFAAYGYPNGRVRVWSTDSLHCLFTDRSVCEPLIALRFGTGVLYGLGASGTVYTFDFHGLVRVFDPQNPEPYWQLYTKEAQTIHQKMFDLGLTYITP